MKYSSDKAQKNLLEMDLLKKLRKYSPLGLNEFRVYVYFQTRPPSSGRFSAV